MDGIVRLTVTLNEVIWQEIRHCCKMRHKQSRCTACKSLEPSHFFSFFIVVYKFNSIQFIYNVPNDNNSHVKALYIVW